MPPFLACLVALPQIVHSPSLYDGTAFGAAVAGAGDVDRDGVPDLVVGEPYWAERSQAGHGARGRVLVYSGRTGALLHAFEGAEEHATGGAVAGAGDVDGDGHADVVFGSHAGPVELRSGRTGELLHAFTGPYEGFGSAVDGGGDVDGDGVPDVLVGAPAPYPFRRDQIPGYAYAFSGADGALLVEECANGSGERVDRDCVDRTTGRGCRACTEALEPTSGAPGFGVAVAFVGDVDGDARDDFAVGAPRVWGDYPGSVAMVSGALGRTLWTVLDCNGSRFGWSLSSFEDVDGDGAPDLFAGSIDESVTLLSGRTGASLVCRCRYRRPWPDGFADTVCRIGDVDEDGVADFVTGYHDSFPDVEHGYSPTTHSGAGGEELFVLEQVVPERLRIYRDELMQDYRDGWSVVGALGDVDGEGTDDYAVGLPRRGIVRVVSAHDQRDLFLLTAPGVPLPFAWPTRAEER